MKEQVTIKELYDLYATLAKPLLAGLIYPWEALPQIGEFIIEIGKNLPKDIYEEKGENIWIAKSAKIYPNNYIAGPCIIGERTEVRPGAFIRGNALLGYDCVVGNSTELKNVILFNKIKWNTPPILALKNPSAAMVSPKLLPPSKPNSCSKIPP